MKDKNAILGEGLLKFVYSVTLDRVDGSVTLFKTEKEVLAWKDPNLEIWGLNKPSPATIETPVDVYGLVKSATFVQMFAGAEVGRLCLTQSQVESFVRETMYGSSWPTASIFSETFFVFHARRAFFVACVHSICSNDKIFIVRVCRFEDPFVWCADDRHRLVVPKLA